MQYMVMNKQHTAGSHFSEPLGITICRI